MLVAQGQGTGAPLLSFGAPRAVCTQFVGQKSGRQIDLRADSTVLALGMNSPSEEAASFRTLAPKTYGTIPCYETGKPLTEIEASRC